MRVLSTLLFLVFCIGAFAQVHTAVVTGTSEKDVTRNGTIFIQYYYDKGTIYNQLAPHLGSIEILIIENPEDILDSIPFEKLTALKRLYVFGNDCSSLERFPERVLNCPNLSLIYHIAMTHEKQLEKQVQAHVKKIRIKRMKDYSYICSMAYHDRPRKRIIIRRNWRCP